LTVLQRLEQMTKGAMLVEQGVLYPALSRLEHRGLLATAMAAALGTRASEA
jgi:DNA-binding PadR family transcriptional regulator